jgi:hypothetical protein
LPGRWPSRASSSPTSSRATGRRRALRKRRWPRSRARSAGGSGSAGRAAPRFRLRELEVRIKGQGERCRYEIRLAASGFRGSLTGAEALERLAARRGAGLDLLAEEVAGARDDAPVLEPDVVGREDPVECAPVASADFGGGILGARDEAQRLVRLLERLVLVSGVVPSVFTVRPRLAVVARCPYCHDGIEHEAGRECPRCGVRHHEECWNEHGACAVFACGPAVAVRIAAP